MHQLEHLAKEFGEIETQFAELRKQDKGLFEHLQKEGGEGQSGRGCGQSNERI